MLALALSLTFALAATSATSVEAAGGKTGGGGGAATVRYTGLITAMVESPEGAYITIGTSYYNTGVVLATSDTNVKLNGYGNVSAYDLWLGDTIQVNALWPSRVAQKIEAIGAR